MTGSNRMLGLVLALAIATPSSAASAVLLTADEVTDKFNEGVELLARGRDAEALLAFQRVLALDPSHEQAYELWKSTDHAVWLEILVKQGDFELVARRLMALAEQGKAERRNDPDEIKGLLARLRGDDVIERRTATRELSALHGQYAVPFMLPTLADRGNEDRRVIYMHTLTEMDTDVVVPLVEALSSDEAYLRRNVALTLGFIGDSRAAGMLAWMAANDADGAAQAAASEALAKIGHSGGALGAFLAAGNDYHTRNQNVLAPHMYSDVVWSWGEGGLSAREIPRDIYGDEMAKRSYARALMVDPGSLDARAGLARSYAVQIAKLEALAEAGQDVEELKAEVDQGHMSVLLAGSDALDAALTTAAQSGDVQSGIALARVLGDVATSATPGLNAALGSAEASLRAEAALALADVALRSNGMVGADVISALADAAGREVVRIIFVVDGDAARAAAVSSGLESQGISAHAFGSAANALAMLHRVPGVDAVLVADSLPDLTTDQVIDDMRSDPRFENTPILVLTANAEQAGELYGESTSGLVTDPADLSAVEEALSGGLDGDRAQANMLAAEAAEKLADLAVSGKDISAALAPLASTLAGRPDDVILPAMHALHVSGGADQVAALIGVLADGDRSDDARVGAGQAAGAIFSRGADGQGSIETLTAVMTSEASLAVKKAAAQALGSMNLDAATRAELLGQAGMQK